WNSDSGVSRPDSTRSYAALSKRTAVLYRALRSFFSSSSFLLGSTGFAFRIGRTFATTGGSSASAGLGCCAGTPGPAQTQSHAVDRIVNTVVARVGLIIVILL